METTPDWSALLGLPAGTTGERRRIGGLYGGALGLTLAVLLPRDRPSLVLHANARESDDVAADLALFGVARGRRLLFPDLDDDEHGLERLAVLTRLRRDAVVIASMEAASQPVPAPDVLLRGRLELAPGEPAPGPQALAERLGADGWNRVSLVTAPKDYVVFFGRWGII